mmetsp:Transcript_12226/g.30915  ORF Transcript_12226/g.30915 Transcript_12226/m.30915 type:complete len:80 (-) Transcript_12226:819-1058(-)
MPKKVSKCCLCKKTEKTIVNYRLCCIDSESIDNVIVPCFPLARPFHFPPADFHFLLPDTLTIEQLVASRRLSPRIELAR